MTDTPITPPEQNIPIVGDVTSVGGRPSAYTQDLADRICALLAEGKSMRTVLLEENMPSMSMVFRWLRENEEFREQYARAKEESADAFIEQIIDLADDAPRVIKGDDKSDSARVHAKQLQIDTRKWIASKLKPKRYGDKLDLTSGGRRIESPVYVTDMSRNNATLQRTPNSDVGSSEGS